MSQFTNALSEYYDKTHRATATITAVQPNVYPTTPLASGGGYAASTTSGGHAILLTSATDSYSTGDVVYYDIKTREILGKASVSSWTDVLV